MSITFKYGEQTPENVQGNTMSVPAPATGNTAAPPPYPGAVPVNPNIAPPYVGAVPVPDTGVPLSDNSALTKHFDSVFTQATADNKNADGTEKPFTLLDAITHGWQVSDTALLNRKKGPDQEMPANEPWYGRLAANSAQLLGDAPYMAEGAAIGMASGFALGGPLGAVVGAGGGGLALPAGLRRIMMDSYEKGDVKTPGEFLERAGGAFLDSAKSFVTGAAGAAAGAIEAPVAVASQVSVAAMATVGAAMEGHLPHAQDFLDAELLFFGTFGVGKGAAKIREIYTQTGKTPAQLSHDIDSGKYPTLKQDLLSKAEIPRVYENQIDPLFRKPPPVTEAEGENPDLLEESKKTEAYKKILESIEKGSKAKGEPFSIRNSWNKFYANYVDGLYPVKQAQELINGGPLPPEEAGTDPYKLMRLTRGGYARSDQWIMHQTMDFNTWKPNGKGLAEILEPVKDDLDGLRVYAKAVHAIDMIARGKNPGIGHNEAMSVANDPVMKAKYDKVAQEMTDYNNRLKQYAIDSGLLSKEGGAAMDEMYKRYVPMNRVMEDEEGAIGNPRGMQTKNPYKKLTGSELKTIDPVELTIKNTYTILSLAEKNHALNTILDRAENADMVGPEGIFEKVKNAARPIEVTQAETEKFLKENGIEDIPDSGLTIFRAQRQPLAPDEFAVWKEGKREVYKTGSPELVEALKGSQSVMTRTAFKVMASMTRTFRAGAILNPNFLATHMMRQQQNLYLNSTTGQLPIVASMRAVGELMGPNGPKLMEMMRTSGALNSEMTAMDRQYEQNSVDKIEGKGNFIDWVKQLREDPKSILPIPQNAVQSYGDMARLALKTAKDASSAPFRWYGKGAHAAIAGHDNLLRSAEFKAVYDKSIDAGMSHKAAMVEAAYQAREVLLDNFKKGANMTAVNQIWAFSALRINGLDKMIRNVSQGGNAGAQAATRLAYLAIVPTVALWFYNHNDRRYKEQQGYKQYNYQQILTDDWRKPQDGDVIPEGIPGMDGKLTPGRNPGEYNFGTDIYIPKSPEIKMLTGALEASLNYIAARKDHDPEAADALKTLGANLGIDILDEGIPALPKPYMEGAANLSFFTHSPLVSSSAENLLSADQGSEYTTQLMKSMGHLIGSIPTMADSQFASPPILENYVRQWTAGVGMLALKASDKALRTAGVIPDTVKPDWQLADYPLIGGIFGRGLGAASASVTKFEHDYTFLNKVVASQKNALNNAVFQANPLNNSDIARYQELQKQFPEALAKLDGFRQAITTQQQFMHNIDKLTVLDGKPVTGHEKRQMLTQVGYQMLSIAIAGNQLMNDMARDIKTPGWRDKPNKIGLPYAGAKAVGQ